MNLSTNVENNNESSFCEKRYDLGVHPQLNHPEFPDALYQYGVMSYHGSSGAFINCKYPKKTEALDPEAVEYLPVKIAPQKTNFVPKDTKFDAGHVYVVRFAISGTKKNPQTGVDHPAICYAFPVNILLEISKGQCSQLFFEGNTAIVRSKVRTVPQSAPQSVIQLDVDTISCLRERLHIEFSENGLVFPSRFPGLCKECGIPNFREYASSVESFLTQFLPEFKLVSNVEVSGTIHPNIIILQSSEMSNPPAEASAKATSGSAKSSQNTKPHILNPKDIDQLNLLFEEGCYAEYLSSPILARIPPHVFSIPQLEKTLTCAFRLLYPAEERSVHLNSFQRELFTAPTALDLAKNWKQDGKYAMEIIEQCHETSITKGDFSGSRIKQVVTYLNAIKESNTTNSTYTHIIKRMAACENELLPYVYLIRAFVQKSKNSSIGSIPEYCQFIKELKNNNSRNCSNNEVILAALPEYLLALYNHALFNDGIPRNNRIFIFSTFFDTGNASKIFEIRPILIDDNKIFHLMESPEQWTEEQFVSLLQDGFSDRLLPKCISYIWERFVQFPTLPIYFLRLLAWVGKYCGVNLLDASLRYKCSPLSTKDIKWRSLVGSTDIVRNEAEADSAMYILACYIIFQCLQNTPADCDDENLKNIISTWEGYSDRFYCRLISTQLPNQHKDLEELRTYFPVFAMDHLHYSELQSKYAELFLSQHRPDLSNRDLVKKTLDELFSKQAYEAYRQLFLLADPKDTLHYIEAYAHSLLSLQRYSDLISFLLRNNTLDSQTRDSLLIKAIYDNFKVNGLTSKAFSVFGDTFSCDNAIDLLLRNINTESLADRCSIMTSLVALYDHERQYIKALYLFFTYQNYAENGYMKLYSHFQTHLHNLQLGKYFGAGRNYYTSVSLAFTALTMEDIMEFLTWAKSIPIPESVSNAAMHVFYGFYDTLIGDPKRKSTWLNFRNHLRERIEINAGILIPCNYILESFFGVVNDEADMDELFMVLLQSENPDNTPYNLLPFIFTHIMRQPNVKLIKSLIEFLQKGTVRAHLTESNPWYTGYEKITNEFREFCLTRYTQTKIPCFYNILLELKLSLSVDDMWKLCEKDNNKQPLFAAICENYLSGKNFEETADLVYNGKWDFLSSDDRNVLALLKVLFADSEEIIDASYNILRDENDVCRLKRDLAGIIRQYPSKSGLFSFEAECTNQAHKLLVFSYIFNLFYDEDIYDRCRKAYSEFQNPQEYRAYLLFTRTVFPIQLIENASYTFLYTRYRYLKMYIADTLLEEGAVDDSRIIAIMKEKRHYNSIYEIYYLPFKQALLAFLENPELPQEAKRHYLYGIMVGLTQDFVASHGDQLLTISSLTQAQMQELAKPLDYRFLCHDVYKLCLREMKEGNFTRALPLSKAVSEFAYDAISALQRSPHIHRALSIFEHLLQVEKPQYSVAEAYRLEDSDFYEYSDILAPFICSSQFDFNIFEVLRKNNGRSKHCNQLRKYKAVTDYLTVRGNSQAEAVYRYLCAMHACLQNDPNEASRILQEVNIQPLIPPLWESEYNHMLKYASGELDTFKMDRRVRDASSMNSNKKKSFTFIDVFRRIIGDISTDNKEDSFEQMRSAYNARRSGTWDKLQLGVAALSICSPQNPDYRSFALQVGLEALDSNHGLSADDRMVVATDLYAHRELLPQDSRTKVSTSLNELLRQKISLTTWINHSDIIGSYLRNNNCCADFDILNREILRPYGQFLRSNPVQESRYNEIQRLLSHAVSIEQLASVFTNSALDAIKEEKRIIEESVRLEIRIINCEDRVTDGYVYFQIKNIGKSAVSLSKDAFSVKIELDGRRQEEIEIKSISDLRSGFVTGARARVVFDDTLQIVKVSLQISKITKTGQQVILSRSTKPLRVSVCPTEFRVSYPMPNSYDVRHAVLKKEMLKGRETDIDNITRSVPQGVTVIYGPSRIGKTSLLNWVQNDFATSKSNVMTILYGGEDGNNKDNDYLSIPYEDDREMSEFLLCKTITDGIAQRRRFIAPNQPTPRNLYSRIKSILNNSNDDIVKRYDKLDRLLGDNNLELWLLLDEFQQVVERWKRPKSGCAFGAVCNLLTNPNDRIRIRNIKLVLCGSDDLLMHMVLDYNSSWKTIFRNASTHSVESFSEEAPFKDMIESDPALNGTGIHFSDEAVYALFKYTGGIPLYGKEICNFILEEIYKSPDLYRGRNTIYVSDIANATQKLLSKQTDDLGTAIGNKEKESIAGIYNAVTKNLDTSTMKYLWYMARWLTDNPTHNGFDKKLFTSKPLKTPNLEDSLKIAQARGIIRLNKGTYEFKTLFFFFAFAGMAPPMRLLEKEIFADETELDASKDAYETLAEYFKLVPHKPTGIDRLYHTMSDDDKKLFDKDSARNNHYGDVVYGDKIGKQNIITVQHISNTLNSVLLAGKDKMKYLKELRELPTLSHYLYGRIQTDGDDASLSPPSEARLIGAIDSLVADYEEALSTTNVDSNTLTSDTTKEKDFGPWEILGIGKDEYGTFMESYGLPDVFLNSLRYAYQVERIFDGGDLDEDIEAIDYSPVTIMYCKLVESMLKEYHLSVYETVLPTASTQIRKNQDEIYLFGDIREVRNFISGRITIGPFQFSIDYDNKKEDISRKGKENIRKLSEKCPGISEDWQKHARALKVIADIRNRSAHGTEGKRITRKDKDRLRKYLFGEGDERGELLRIIRLVCKKSDWS